MTIPITVTVTGSGSKDRAVCQNAPKVSSPVGVSFQWPLMGVDHLPVLATTSRSPKVMTTQEPQLSPVVP